MTYTIEIISVKESGHIICDISAEMNKHLQKIQKWIIETQEEGTRRELIELGWTPPKGRE